MACGRTTAAIPDASNELDGSGDTMDAAVSDPCFGLGNQEACVGVGAPDTPCAWTEPCGKQFDASMCLYHGPRGCAAMQGECFAGEKCVVVPTWDPKFGECGGFDECAPQSLLDEYLDAGLGWKIVGDE
jgi:hypothetical protein